EIADLVELYLLNEGYQVSKYHDSVHALTLIENQEFDLAVLDIMMPGIDGLTLCRKIREQYHYPVIFLTAKVEDMDKIFGLSLGADDYITKPFNPLELVARVKAQLRRYKRYNHDGGKDDPLLEYNGLTIDKDSHVCTLNGKAIALTPLEFEILWLLMDNRGKVISAEEILSRIWGEAYLDGNNTVMVHIRRIREKLAEPPRNPRFIKTIWGVGYKIDTDQK
ncbi:MAG: response regulator transcription factor, partial [Clostridiales bacterium]